MQNQFHQQLLFAEGTQVPHIDLQDIYNDPTQRTADWSFIKDSRTQWPVPRAEWLIQRVAQEPTLRRRFSEPDGQGFRMRAINRYFAEVARFRERLSVAIHITAGQPSRTPELLSIRY
jgi:hypothetical protein